MKIKILFVSMPSIHVIRWIENLKESNFELYWFDVLDKGTLDTTININQITGWKKRKIPYIKGEYFFRKKLSKFYNKIQFLLEVTPNEKLEQIIKDIKPDIIHSFEMQSCCYPILKTMNKFPSINWLYSCWGSDLYFYKNFLNHSKLIKNVLKRVDYLHTDCKRDYNIAKSLGFLGKHIGVIPGGTGYNIEELEKFKLPVDQRKIILVKGYQHQVGRGLNIVKALSELQSEIKEYKVILFAAHQEVINYIDNNKLPFKVYSRDALKHSELLALMGMSKIYIGNSISDGMPNTLLEAIVMGAFPIQSNPGQATQEIITDKINGLLIENPESIQEIKTHLKLAIFDQQMIIKAFEINCIFAKQKLDYEINKIKVNEIYKNFIR